MPIFNFYRFENKQVDNGPSFFAAEEAAEARFNQGKYQSPRECFGSFFTSKQRHQLSIMKSHGSAGAYNHELYNCDVVVSACQDVILPELESNGTKTTIENKKRVKHPNHPYCRVIIDNREGYQIVAIEKNAAFSGDTDKAALVLQKGFNQKLSVYGREIVIQPLHKKTTDFWPVVWDIRKKFNDRVRFIKLDFRGEGENKSANGLMALITQLARKGDCAALLELSHKPGSPEINLQELHDDLTHIAAICLNEGIFDLTVHFAHFGCYRYGADIMAQFGIEEEAISSFGVELLSCFDGNSPTFALIQWMDKMNEILKDYANTGILQKGRKKGPRRKAC